MAGIGFELKKLFKHKSLLFSIRAYLFSGLVSAGPLLLCTTMITILQFILTKTKIAFDQRELFLAATVYAFIFSQIITSGFSMIITRFVSDKIYTNDSEDIPASLYGVISVCLIIGGIIGGVFYYKSNLQISFKLSAYILYMELIIMWLQSVYLSALKDYIRISKSFLYGTVTSIVCAYVLLKINIFIPSISMLIAMDFGIFTIILSLMVYIESFFKEKSKKYFLFLEYLGKYPSLFCINFFYALSLYIHNFIFWKSNLAININNTYVFCPLYDVAIFYAFFTTIPSMILFVVSMETSFYEKYKDYYRQITEGGSLNEISNSKNEMIRVLWNEIVHLMQIQLFFSIVFLIIGIKFLPMLGIIEISINIFSIMVLGAYSNIILLITMLIQLYFEDRKGALIISSVFLMTNAIASYISLKLGEDFYGFGFFVAATFTLILSLIRLSRFLKDINYNTFCTQPIFYKEHKNIFSRLVNHLYGE